MTRFERDDPDELARELGPEFSKSYEILGVLGRGGMGLVLRVRQRDLNRQVAIKLMLHSTADARQRFQREGKLLARLRHPNIVAVLAIGEARGNPFLVFELVEGETLRERIDRYGPLPVAMAIQTVRQVAEGLSLAHEQGILHRDVKCTNVMLSREGVAKLADFGLALGVGGGDRITRAGMFMGTPEYTAPEVIRGDPPQPASDLYSLGMVLHEAIVGRTSFGNLPIHDMMKAHLDQEPSPLRALRPEAPAWLEAVLNRLLAKDPRRRYSGAAQVARVLTDGVEGRIDSSGLASGDGRTQAVRAVVRDDLDQTSPSGEKPLLFRSGPGEGRTGPGRKSRVRLVLGTVGGLVGLVLVLLAIPRGASESARVTDVKLDATIAEARVTWRTNRRVEAWIEYLEDGPAAGNWRSTGVRARDAAIEHSETLTGLTPGGTYRLRVITNDGGRSLEYSVRTFSPERPRLLADESGPQLRFETARPLLGSLVGGGRSLPERDSVAVTRHRFSLPARDVLAGVEGLEYVHRTPWGSEARVALPALPGLPQELAAQIDVASLAAVLKDLYASGSRAASERERIFARIKALPFFPVLTRFRAVADDFFGDEGRFPDAIRSPIYNRMVDLESLDAAARDFHLEPLVQFTTVTKSYVRRSFAKAAWRPRFRWKSDYTLRDMYWVPEQDHPEIKRFLNHLRDVALVVHRRHKFRIEIPAFELAAARRVALTLRISNLVNRSFFDATVNDRLRLAYRPATGWDYDVLTPDANITNEFPARFFKPGVNTVEVAMRDSPGVIPMSHAQIWAVEAVGE